MLRDELRMVVINEHDSAQLSELPAEIFARTARALDEMDRNITRSEAGEGREHLISVVEEMQNIKESLHDIMRTRDWKIIQLAMVRAEGNHPEKDEMRRMTPAERHMFDEMVGAIQRCRHELTQVPGEGEQAEGGEVTAGDYGNYAGEEETERADVPRPVLVRILEDIEPFMGMDGRVYTLRQEDIVSLPEENAGVLCEHRIALSMRLSK